MAKPKLTAMADLKAAFGAPFDDMSNLIDTMRTKANEITEFNKNSAGNDDLGKTYHKQVDDPTTNLDKLLQQVRDAVDNAGHQGQNTTDLLNAADQNAKDSA
ncbi:hypothetical protein P3T37_002663 [Kitasatospora sp. MAA4]|uniref:hypothetical protein n=1 Tax=Kitasatospora sp. MAA4 TaxID=3035093 RepID=UPI0024744FBE|nr:hypothetical protein [Kitasatospora sp. MAA4]MDH6133268.1 hypothetical protein [Kitasatospora sp. MAA4]